MEQNEKNCQKPQKLTKEELEQVNGGGAPFPEKGPNTIPGKRPKAPWE